MRQRAGQKMESVSDPKKEDQFFTIPERSILESFHLPTLSEPGAPYPGRGVKRSNYNSLEPWFQIAGAVPPATCRHSWRVKEQIYIIFYFFTIPPFNSSSVSIFIFVFVFFPPLFHHYFWTTQSEE